jgi:hypothetical protein
MYSWLDKAHSSTAPDELRYFTGNPGMREFVLNRPVEARGLPCSFYSDRGSHYWLTPEAEGKVDKQHLTPFGAAMKRLGIDTHLLPGSARTFGTGVRHASRQVSERTCAGGHPRTGRSEPLPTPEVSTGVQRPKFTVPAREEGTAFVAWIGGDLSEQLCERHERGVGADNSVKFEKLNLQIPADRHRYHYVKAKVQVHRAPDRRLSVFHGPRKLADYTPEGKEVTPEAALKRSPERQPTVRRALPTAYGLRPPAVGRARTKADNSKTDKSDKSKTRDSSC